MKRLKYLFCLIYLALQFAVIKFGIAVRKVVYTLLRIFNQFLGWILERGGDGDSV